ncbi:hypothetical protein FXO38_02715 [Capsicum annuum]|nr:hypothetical protein FXO38_02715 [Capsicum annuum]
MATTFGRTIPPEDTSKRIKEKHGEPSITWNLSKVKSLVVQENLQHAIVGKFSYGKPDVNKLRKLIPKQCAIKGDCTIGVLDIRDILIRLNQLEDYVQLLSTFAYFIKSRDRYWQMRTLKWDLWFELDVETMVGVAWTYSQIFHQIFLLKKLYSPLPQSWANFWWWIWPQGTILGQTVHE